MDKTILRNLPYFWMPSLIERRHMSLADGDKLQESQLLKFIWLLLPIWIPLAFWMMRCPARRKHTKTMSLIHVSKSQQNHEHVRPCLTKHLAICTGLRIHLGLVAVCCWKAPVDSRGWFQGQMCPSLGKLTKTFDGQTENENDVPGWAVV